VTARFNEKRQDTSQADEDVLANCGANDDDRNCMLFEESLIECEETVGQVARFRGLEDCLSALCPNTDPAVINCVSDPFPS
jgi:hypothetical protein